MLLLMSLPNNLTSWQFKAVIKEISVAVYPPTYRWLVVYFNGHGGNGKIYTPDGFVRLVDITKPLSPNRAPRLGSMTKIFILDTCSLNKESFADCIFPNSVFVFPALPGYPAFTENGDCGLLTRHLSPALRSSLKSIGDVITDVTSKITNEIQNNSEWRQQVPSESQPVLCQSVEAHVYLRKEQLAASMFSDSIVLLKLYLLV